MVHIVNKLTEVCASYSKFPLQIASMKMMHFSDKLFLASPLLLCPIFGFGR